MSMLKKVILREETRNANMISEYSNELLTLPKGKIIPKIVNSKTYYYLYYRDGKKVISKYLGKDEKYISQVREQLMRRSQIEEILKRLKEEKNQIKKMETML